MKSKKKKSSSMKPKKNSNTNNGFKPYAYASSFQLQQRGNIYHTRTGGNR